MTRCSRGHIDGAPVALAIYAVVCCAVTVCLALGLYELMQTEALRQIPVWPPISRRPAR